MVNGECEDEIASFVCFCLCIITFFSSQIFSRGTRVSGDGAVYCPSRHVKSPRFRYAIGYIVEIYFQ